MSGMKIIKPTTITPAMLASSTVPEPDAANGEVAWNAATNYAVGAEVIRTTTHCKYMRKVSGTSATLPENDTTNWQNIGPTNRWAMFDRKVGTATKAATTVTAVMTPGPVSGLGALELVGREAKVTLTVADTIVYERELSLDGRIVTTVYDWFFGEYEQLTDFVLTDLPQHFATGQLTVEVSGTAGASIGVLQVGQVLEVGHTLFGGSVGINDNSRKEKDAFGNMDVTERSYSKRMNLQVVTKKSDFNKLYRKLAELRATPCIYIGADEPGNEPMINYGFYKDFGIAVSYPQLNLLNIEIEGLS